MWKSLGNDMPMLKGDGSKLPKSEVEFEHPAKGPDHCGLCTHYSPSLYGTRGRCEIVRGVIESGDWCNRFERQSGDVLDRLEGPNGETRYN